MQSTVGKLGKVIVAKFEHGEDFIAGLGDLSKKHKIKAGVVLFLGALKGGRIVTGPKMPVVPPEPNWFEFDDGREVFGVGTIFREGNTPKLHLHTGMGKGDQAIVGCVREKAKIFLVIEAIIIELRGIKADKAVDPQTGLMMLRILSGGPG
jgi:predicted DNA-binding protein with PD1-like motif